MVRERRNSSRARCGIGLACAFVVLVGVGVIFAATQLNADNNNANISTNGGSIATPTAPSTLVDETTPSPTLSPTVNGFQTCNGFENLCDVRVNEVAFAMLHNAVATVADGVPSFAANHQQSLESALASGWRGLNFDIGKCDGELRLVHAICSLGTRDPVVVFTNILSALRNNPNDVILMPVQIDNGVGGNVSLAEIYAVMEQVPGFTTQLYQYMGGSWPTLRELISAGTRILFFHYNGNYNCPSLITTPTTECPLGFHHWFDFAAETAFEFDSATALLNNPGTSCEITRGGSGTRDFFGVNMFTMIPSTTACQTLNGATNVAEHVESCAAINGGLRPLVVLVDCWSVGDVLTVANQYNAQLNNV